MVKQNTKKSNKCQKRYENGEQQPEKECDNCHKMASTGNDFDGMLGSFAFSRRLKE